MFKCQTPAGDCRGLISVLTGASTENLHFLLFIVCRPIVWRDFMEEFHIHFISSFITSVSFASINNLYTLYVPATLKETGVANSLKNTFS